MVHACRIIFNRCTTPALRGIAGFKRMPICAVLQAAYAYLRGIAGCICLSARYRRLHMLQVCRIIFNRCSTPALRGIAGFKLMPICAVLQAAYAYLRGIAGCICLSARYRRLHMLQVCRIIFNSCSTPTLRGIAGFKLMPICAVSQAAYAYLRGIAGCICFRLAELSLIVVRLPLCAVSQGSSLCLSARYRRLHMFQACRIIFNRCSISALRGFAGRIHI